MEVGTAWRCELNAGLGREELMVQSMIELVSSYADYVYTLSSRYAQCKSMPSGQVLIRVSAGEQKFEDPLEDQQVGVQFFADLENSRCHSAVILRLMHAP